MPRPRRPLRHKLAVYIEQRFVSAAPNNRRDMLPGVGANRARSRRHRPVGLIGLSRSLQSQSAPRVRQLPDTNPGSRRSRETYDRRPFELLGVNPRRDGEIALAHVPGIVGRDSVRGMTSESVPPVSDSALPTGESIKCAVALQRPARLGRSSGHAPASPSLSCDASGADGLFSAAYTSTW